MRLGVSQLSAVTQVGGAELHLQEDNRVPLSQGVYTLPATKSGQVEGASLWAGMLVWERMCVCVCMQREQSGVCWRLWPLRRDKFPLQPAKLEPVSILPHAPLFIFQDLVMAYILWACPGDSSPLTIITITYGDINDHGDHVLYNVLARLKDHCIKTVFLRLFIPLSIACHWAENMETASGIYMGMQMFCCALTDSSWIGFPLKKQGR